MGPEKRKLSWRGRAWLATGLLALLLLAGTGGTAVARTALSPIAQFTRISFTDTPHPNDSKLQLAVVQAGPKAASFVKHLRQVASGIRVLAYQAFIVRASDGAGLTGCLPGKGSYPANWYLHGRSGSKAAWTGSLPSTYQMDIGNKAYLQACAKHALSIAHSMGADGVFLDQIGTSVHWEQLAVSCSGPGASGTCSSDKNWQNAMTSALGYMASQLHAHKLMLFGNVGGGNITFCCGGGPAIWQRYVSKMDGAMEETWTYATNGKPVPTSEVQAGLANTAWSEAHGKYTIVNDDIRNCQACSDYGLATMMLVTNGYASYDVSNGAYSNYAAWFPSYNTAKSLGPAIGNGTRQSNGLMVRRFAAGDVVVNDTGHAISDPVFGTVPAHAGQFRSPTSSLPGGGTPLPAPGGGSNTGLGTGGGIGGTGIGGGGGIGGTGIGGGGGIGGTGIGGGGGGGIAGTGIGGGSTGVTLPPPPTGTGTSLPPIPGGLRSS